jgi:UDP-N-acetylglucosamine--N-acetylmuramyl-(pentapeptide) pyrophosphoryl-undecaprenol N-acetylglucosamine transferase
VVLTGNPVRPEILAVSREKARKELGLDERPLVLSFGGSLGAANINRAMLTVLKASAENGQLQHIHGYGQHDPTFPQKLAEMGVDLKKNPQIRVLDYINNMAQCLAAADLVISRSGAISLTEIEALGKGSILIPSPNVAENHQYHNAMALVRRGAAEILEEKDLTGESLLAKIQSLFAQSGKVASLGIEAKKMSVPDVNERIYQVIVEAAKG